MALFKGKNEFLCPLRYLPHKKHKNEKMNQLSIISTKWVAYLRKITLQYNIILSFWKFCWRFTLLAFFAAKLLMTAIKGIVSATFLSPID